MRQVFLKTSEPRLFQPENQDAFPVSERLIPELAARFGLDEEETVRAPAVQVVRFLRDFYSRYELSYPQRRVWQRLEKTLAETVPEKQAELMMMDVSAHRNRRFSKKT